LADTDEANNKEAEKMEKVILKEGFCNCGFPQSYPIQHEHEQSDREKEIIKYYEEIILEKNLQLRTAEKNHYAIYKQLSSQLAEATEILEKHNLI
jgi:hypothetical protein